MKRYILTLFGDFSEEKIVKEIISMIIPVVDSPNLKFHKFKNSLLVHFASEVYLDELTFFLEGGVDDLYSTFVLAEFNDSVSIRLSPKISEDFLDLNNHNDETSELWVIKDENIELDDGEFYDEFEDGEDFIRFFFDKVKNRVKKPSLDQLLDKISNNGMKSLSSEEVKILKQYSKV